VCSVVCASIVYRKAVRLLTFARLVRLRLQFVDFGSVSVTIRLPITMLIRLNCLLILGISGAWQLNINGVDRILCWTVGGRHISSVCFHCHIYVISGFPQSRTYK
jgi:hypothetical protein